jgi:hypothetical protein
MAKNNAGAVNVAADAPVVRLGPQQYMHVLDLNAIGESLAVVDVVRCGASSRERE